jgi:hypothetical protein
MSSLRLRNTQARERSLDTNLQVPSMELIGVHGDCDNAIKMQKKRRFTLVKTYNSGDSPVVTHLTTSPPVRCLNRAERTGSLVFNVLWSYVLILPFYNEYDLEVQRNARSVSSFLDTATLRNATPSRASQMMKWRAAEYPSPWTRKPMESLRIYLAATS